VKENLFGIELVIDLIDCNIYIQDPKQIRYYITKLIDLIGMKKYGKTILKHFGHNDKRTSGYTALQLVETSLVSAHFGEHYHTMHLNVFSCKSFDTQAATQFTIDFFGGEVVTNTVLERRLK
jgi:S-adenosylmethionine/arginine decarboxylase-like enzyme